MKKEFTYKKYSSIYKAQVITLLSNALWNFSSEECYNYFEWKFERNPFTEEPLAFIALDGDKVVAFRGYFVQPISYNGNVFLNASLADTVTDKDYRNLGLFKSLTKYSIDEIRKNKDIKFSLNSSSGGATLKGYTDLGWKALSERNNLFYFSFRGIIKHFLCKKSIVLPTVLKRKDGGCVEISRELKLSQLTSIVPPNNMITHQHSETYYKWRLSNPISQYICIYNFDKDGGLIAFMILKEISKGKFDIIDFNSGCINSLKQILKGIVQTLSPIYLTLWTANKSNTIIDNSRKLRFYSLDFILLKLKKFKRPPLLIHIFDDDTIIPLAKWNLNKIIADEI